MPKPRRDPYVAMDATIRNNAKLAALPSDTARLGWLYVGLGSAKLQRPSGCFRSRAHWHEVAGRFGRYLAQYLDQGLIEQAPKLCERCEAAWPELPAGALVIHDWTRHQTNPGAAGPIEEPKLPIPGFERTRRWRERQSDSDADMTRNVTAIPGDSDADVTDSDDVVTTNVTSPRARSRGTPRSEHELESRDTREGLTRSSSSRGARPDGSVDPSREEEPDWLAR